MTSCKPFTARWTTSAIGSPRLPSRKLLADGELEWSFDERICSSTSLVAEVALER
jgi:hypothetical protein